MPASSPAPGSPKRTGRISWAAQLERVYAVDAMACPRCGARLRLVAVITRASIIDKILNHLLQRRRGSTPTAPPE